MSAVRRTLILVAVALLAFLGAPRAEASLTKITITPGGEPDKDPASVPVGDDVFWQNDDVVDHTIKLEDGRKVTAAVGKASDSVTIDNDVDYVIDPGAHGPFHIKATEPTTTTEATTSSTT